MAILDYNGLLAVIWGWPYDCGGAIPAISIASNVVVGTNPPYSVTDFLNLYPKFGGKPVAITATADGTTAVLTNVSSVAGITVGNYLTGFAGIQSGTTVLGTTSNPNTITLSKPTTQAGTPIGLSVFTTPLVPMAVLNAYIYLASNSLFADRWGEGWLNAMGLYIAHFATLWLQGEASSPNSTAGQAAASGLALGVDISQSAGDVSYSVQPVIVEDAGAFNLTIYGQQLPTFAKVIGSGTMLLW